MSYEIDPITNEIIDLDPSSNDLGKRLLNNITIFDDPAPGSMSQGQPKPEKKKNSLNPKEYKQMMNYLTRPKNKKNFKTGDLVEKEIQKDSIEPRRVPFKKKSDTKVPPKLAKDKEDLEQEFNLFEVPIIMKEYEDWIKDNPGKSFRDYLRDQKLILEKQKKQLDDMVLSGALAKIDNVMSGIMTMAKGGIIRDPTYTYYNSGGKVKRPPPIKKLNLADYFRYGATIAELTDSERKLVNELLKKTLSKSSTDN
ncbi:hypothetical protein [Hyphomonas sp.]|jgi:hypothetical protein|uniref:hypothetical protein n=1 Tax=Hyphomonas sp. TaxID=87 RepID=UPI000C98AA7D|nr:hypothetical protein [Hyphomonas sp.]MAL45640.1 hypothetical protein [Hyphomonas sp.]